MSENIPSRKPILSDSISIFLGLPESMTLVDEKLLINDFAGIDGFIQVYDLKNKKTLSPFAKRGDGPNEFLSVSNIDSYYRNDSLFVGLFDGNYRKYTAYYRDNFTTPLFCKGVLIDYTVNELHRIKDGYIATGIFPQGKFAFLDDSFNVLKFAGEYRPNKEQVATDNLMHARANLGTSVLSKEKDVLVNILHKAGVVEAYQLEKDSIFKIWEYVIEDLNYSVSDANIYNETVEGFISVKTTEENIFALYSGEIDAPHKTAIYGKTIFKFDYEGNLVELLYLDREAIDFAIQGDQLYSLTHLPEPTILIYDWPI